MSIADIVVIVILAIFLIVGIARGFLASIFGFLGGLVSLIVAVLLCGKLATLLDAKFELIDLLSNWIEGWFSGNAAFNADISSSGLEAGLAASGIPSFISAIILKIPAVQNNTLAEGTTLANLLAPTIAYYMLCFLCIIALYIVLRIFFAILKALAKKVNEVPIIGAVNRLLGAGLGVIEGVIVIYVLLFVMSILPATWMAKPNEEIQKSTVAKYLSDANLLGKALNGVIDLDAISDKLSGKENEETPATGSIEIGGEIYDVTVA